MNDTFYVYMLASHKHGTLYVGVTNDLVRRVHEHRTGVTDGFTKQYDVKHLVWFADTADVGEAIAQEKRMKRWRRQWKIDLIEKENPDWRDLYDEIV